MGLGSATMASHGQVLSREEHFYRGKQGVGRAAINKESMALFFFFFGLFAFSRTAPTAHGGSQARGLIRAIASGLCQSHSKMRSEPCL